MEFGEWFRKKWYISFVCLAIGAGLGQYFLNLPTFGFIGGIFLVYVIYKVQEVK
jgi:hypothetical protein